MFCIKCGNELVKDSKFCHSCGTEVVPLKEEEGLTAADVDADLSGDRHSGWVQAFAVDELRAEEAFKASGLPVYERSNDDDRLASHQPGGSSLPIPLTDSIVKEQISGDL